MAGKKRSLPPALRQNAEKLKRGESLSGRRKGDAKKSTKKSTLK